MKWRRLNRVGWYILFLNFVFILSVSAQDTVLKKKVDPLSFAKTTKDSLFVCLKLGNGLRDEDSSLSWKYLTLADTLLTEVPGLDLENKVLRAKGLFCMQNGNLSDALTYLLQWEQNCMELNQAVIPELNITIANAYIGLMDNLKAIRYLNKVDVDTLPDRNKQALYNAYFVVYSRLDEIDKALSYANRTEKIAGILKDYRVQYAIKTNLGSLFQRRKEYAKAVEYFKQAIALDSIHHCRTTYIDFSHLSEIYFTILRDTINGIKVVRQGSRVSKSRPVEGYEQTSIIQMEIILTKWMIKKSQLDSSEVILKRALKEAQQLDLYEVKGQLYENLIELYRKKGDPDLERRFITAHLAFKSAQIKKQAALTQRLTQELISEKSEEPKRSSKWLSTSLIALFIILGGLTLYYMRYWVASQKEGIDLDKKNYLKDQKKEALHQALKSLLEEEKIYLNPQLRLSDLANQLGTSRTYISTVINDCFDMNFNALLAHYRVMEAKQLLTCSKIRKNFTMEYVSEQSGFNSLASFNRSFKKVTGKTPTTYRNELG